MLLLHEVKFDMMFSASKSLFKITEFFRYREDSLARLPLYAIFWYLVRLFYFGGCCCHDHMVVEFTTTYAISAYHHWHCEFKPHSCRGVLYATLCYKVCQRSVVFSGYSGFKHHKPTKPSFYFAIICHIYNIF